MLRLLPLLRPLAESGGILILCILPGWLAARRADSDRLVRLLVAALVSTFVYYQVVLIAYALGLPSWAAPLGCVAIALGAAGAIGGSAERRRELVESFPFEAALIWLATVWFALGLQANLVGCGVGSWGNDWHEHYSRSLLFADHRPPTTTFSAMQWTVPARGPLFNATCAVFLGLFGGEFWNYQVAATVLNTMAVLGIAVALRDFAGVGERAALLMGGVLGAISPFAVTEIAYPWTKFLTVASILCGLRFFLIALESGRESALLWASFSFASGILTHYYVAIPAAMCGLYSLKARRAVTALGGAAAVGALTIAPWILYCVVTFGFAGTFAANSTVRSAKLAGATYPLVVAGNLLSSTFPPSVRHVFPDFARSWHPILLSADEAGRWISREEDQDPLTIWMIDLVNGNFSILGTLGLAGMFAVLLAALAWDRRRREGSPIAAPPISGPTSFWVFFLSAGVLLTVMSYPRYADNGLRGAGLHVYILLIAVLAVRQLRDASRPAVLLLAAVFLAESAVVSGAYVALQARDVPLHLGASGLVAEPGAALDPLYIKNYAEKLQAGLVFLSDYLGPLRSLFTLLATVSSVALFVLAGSRRTLSGARSDAA